MAPFSSCSDFGAQENMICHCFHFFPHLFAMKWWDWMPWFWTQSFKPAFPLSSFTLNKRLFTSSVLWVIKSEKQAENKNLVLSPFSHVSLCDPVDCSLLYPWDSPGKNTGVGCHFFLQEIFPSLLQLLHCRWILYCWATWKPKYICWLSNVTLTNLFYIHPSKLEIDVLVL